MELCLFLSPLNSLVEHSRPLRVDAWTTLPVQSSPSVHRSKRSQLALLTVETRTGKKKNRREEKNEERFDMDTSLRLTRANSKT
jgi:hypothetical protein